MGETREAVRALEKAVHKVVMGGWEGRMGEQVSVRVELDRVTDGVYALGPYRIQRGTRRWYWHHVVAFGETAKLRGEARTLRLAVADIYRAVYQHERATPPAQP
jgi:hypothetical protein